MLNSRISHFVGRSQIEAIRQGMKGEEKQYFIEIVEKLADHFSSMPKTYEQDGLGEKAVVGLHYFSGGSDWWILEKDMEEEDQQQAFGFTVLNGDKQNAGLGYINIVELINHNVELDFHFTTCTIGELKKELQIIGG